MINTDPDAHLRTGESAGAPRPPELRDVHGPSALGGGWRRSLELLYLMAVMEFRRTYLNTVLGYLWSVCRPLLLFAVLLAVFTHIVHLSAGIPHYPVLLLLNIVLFGFFQEATSTSVGSVVGQEAVVRKTQFPRLVIPLAVVTTSAFNLAMNLVVVFVFILAFQVSPLWTWLLLPVLLIWLSLFTIGVAMILSSLYPRFRDVGIIWAVFATALFYATPIIYTMSSTTVHGTIGKLVALNPLTPLFELARRWIITPDAPVVGGVLPILVPIVLTISMWVFAVWVFNREAPRIAEAL
ncbi:MAG: ABC transporter permease [Solirubrobacteraceae bacterium]